MSNQKKSSIQAIIFDLGGVLIDWHPEHLYRKMFAGDPDGMAYFLTEVCPMEWNIMLDKGYSYAKAVEERILLFPEYAAYIQAFHTRWDEMVPGEFPKTVELLAALRDAGYSLHVLSNFSAETFPRMVSRFDFLQWFDSILISAEVGLAKPDPAIYQLLLGRIGFEPQQCLFIDDSEKNVLAARDLGIDAIYFTSTEDLHQQLVDKKLLEPGQSPLII